jgi:hypothetical protein
MNKELPSIPEVLSGMEELLLYKNEKYGDSTGSPLNAFSKLSGEEGILVRLDDKLKRIITSPELRKNDVSDMIGYLVLLCRAKGWTNFKEYMD